MTFDYCAPRLTMAWHSETKTSALEMHHDKALCRFTLLYFTFKRILVSAVLGFTFTIRI